jgi:hypothetical protein
MTEAAKGPAVETAGSPKEGDVPDPHHAVR